MSAVNFILVLVGVAIFIAAVVLISFIERARLNPPRRGAWYVDEYADRKEVGGFDHRVKWDE